MSNLVVVNLPRSATVADIRDVFAYHEYGKEFLRALDLRAEDPDEELGFDDWFPLNIEIEGDSVVVNYRVMFISGDKLAYDWSDRRIVGVRAGDAIEFSTTQASGHAA